MTSLDSQLKRELHNTNIAYIAAAASSSSSTAAASTAAAFIFTHFRNFLCVKLFNLFDLLANNFYRKQIATNKRST